MANPPDCLTPSFVGKSALETIRMHNDIFDKTYKYLIISFINKTYKKNSENEINIFLDEIIKSSIVVVK